jgi:hypothetical protein
MSSKAWEQELGKLLRLIGAEAWERAPQPLVTSPQIGKAAGNYCGTPCTAVWMNNQMALDPELAGSVSLIIELPRPLDAAFQLRNSNKSRHLPFTPPGGMDASPAIDPRILTAEEVSDLSSMEVPFLLSLLQDRVSITIYGLYPLECYESFLDLLRLIHERAAGLG